MQLLTLREAQVLEVARHSWAEDVNAPATVAEALRAELWARRVSTRRALCQRVLELMQPVRALDLDMVKTTLADLERCGDVTVGERGMLATAPLRAIDVGAGRYLLVGGPETARLRQLLGRDVVSGSSLRAVQAAEDEDGLRANVITSGGVILTPERWCGLDRAPLADAAWLRALDTEIVYNPGAEGTLGQACADWRSYVPDSSEADQWSRWQRPVEGRMARLWRAWHDRGYQVYVWTSGGHPQRSAYLRLSQDHAYRTAFALDREAGCPIVMGVEDYGDAVTLDVGTLLPAAEYRFLLTLGQRLETARKPSYRFAKRVWPQVVSMLETRLGVVVAAPGGTT